MTTFEKIEIKYADARVRENERRVPEQFRLLELAKEAATQGQFQESLELRDQSRLVTQKDLEKRLQIVDEEFEANITKALAQQREEIIGLGERLQVELNNLEEATNHKYSEMNANRDKELTSLFQRISARIKSTIRGREDATAALQRFQSEMIDVCQAYECQVPDGISTIVELSYRSQPTLRSSKRQ